MSELTAQQFRDVLSLPEEFGHQPIIAAYDAALKRATDAEAERDQLRTFLQRAREIDLRYEVWPTGLVELIRKVPEALAAPPVEPSTEVQPDSIAPKRTFSANIAYSFTGRGKPNPVDLEEAPPVEGQAEEEIHGDGCPCAGCSTLPTSPPQPKPDAWTEHVQHEVSEGTYDRVPPGQAAEGESHEWVCAHSFSGIPVADIPCRICKRTQREHTEGGIGS